MRPHARGQPTALTLLPHFMPDQMDPGAMRTWSTTPGTSGAQRGAKKPLRGAIEQMKNDYG